MSKKNSETSIAEEIQDTTQDITIVEDKTQATVSQTQKSGSGLSVLALLIGLVGAGGAGYTFWQQQETMKVINAKLATTETQLATANSAISNSLSKTAIDNNSSSIKELMTKLGDFENSVNPALAKSEQAESEIKTLGSQIENLANTQKQILQQNSVFDSQLAALPSQNDLTTQKQLIIQLQSSQQKLSQHLDDAISSNRQRWRVVEADHLLRLASIRLQALQDVAAAESLVQAANEIFDEQDDPTSYGAREKLNISLQQLRATERPDRAKIFLTLNGLRNNIDKLSVNESAIQTTGNKVADLALEIKDTDEAGNVDEKLTIVKRVLATLSSFFKIDFESTEEVRPILSGQSLNQVRLALSISLEQAQWAALNGKTDVYIGSLNQASDILSKFFDTNHQGAKAMLEDIANLKTKTIDVKMPDLTDTIEAVQLYVMRKQKQDEQAGNVPMTTKTATQIMNETVDADLAKKVNDRINATTENTEVVENNEEATTGEGE